MSDAVDVLLRDKQHPEAERLLHFHRDNPDFLPRIVAELRLLKTMGRKAGSIRSLINFLRWEQHWHSDDVFEVNDHLGALAARVCVLLWRDVNGMMKFRPCLADEILGTRIVKRGKRYGNFLYPGKTTFQLETVLDLPAVPVLDRPPTIHSLITEQEAESIAAPLRDIVTKAPNPDHQVLQDWLRHIERQPEIYAFMEKTLLKRRPRQFSARSILEYCRWSIRRAAKSHKRFTLRSQFDGLYCRALIIENPEFNGLCEFRSDSEGLRMHGRANRLLGTGLEPEPINGEPYRRLYWKGHETSRKIPA